MAWKVEFEAAALRELNKLDPQVARRILNFLRERVSQLENPWSIAEPLKGSKLGLFWRYRVGDWRIIASIDDVTFCILVVRIGNRRNVYR